MFLDLARFPTAGIPILRTRNRLVGLPSTAIAS